MFEYQIHTNILPEPDWTGRDRREAREVLAQRRAAMRDYKVAVVSLWAYLSFSLPFGLQITITRRLD
jgi:hypothetical protein